MAKSKSGGTRSYIRGKIGADVYSIGKDGKGAKQQVVRSLAEVVSNPQTEAQMRGRMIMSTVMQAVSALSPVIDHSFDDVPNGQPAISEFISKNYALVKADVAAHPSTGNTFGLNKYQQKGILSGLYLVSDGTFVVASDTLTLGDIESGNNHFAAVAVPGFEENITKQAYVDSLGLTPGDFITILAVLTDGTIKYARFHVVEFSDPETIVTAENAASLFTVESNGTTSIGIEQYSGDLRLQANSTAMAMIVSHKDGSSWQHNQSYMIAGPAATTQLAAQTADIALATYPIGASRFLNGGDI